MKKTTTTLAALTVLALLIATPAFAQGGGKWRGSGGWGPGSQYDRQYNPQTVETVSGEVVAVEQITPIKGMSPGVICN